MTENLKRSARALLFDGDGRLVLIERTKPGQEPYWVTGGGGAEPEDVDIEATLRREVLEELGGRIDRVREVLLITGELPGGIGLQHVFTAHLISMDLDARTGPEFTEPGRGTYEMVHLPATYRALSRIRLLPFRLAEFVLANLSDHADSLTDKSHSSGIGAGMESPTG